MHGQLCIWQGPLPLDGLLVLLVVCARDPAALHSPLSTFMAGCLELSMMKDFMPAALCPCPPCHLQDYYDELIRHYRYQKRVGGAPQGRPAGPRAARLHAAMCC